MSEIEERKVTTGTEWRRAREQGEIVKLPSDKVVRLRPLSLLGLIKRGRIPDPLAALINEMIGGEKKVAADLNTFQSFGDLLDLVCVIAFVEPKIVENPEADDEISVEDVHFDDQLFVFNRVQSEVNLTVPFRPESDGDVEGVPASDDVPPAAVGPDGD